MSSPVYELTIERFRMAVPFECRLEIKPISSPQWIPVEGVVIDLKMGDKLRGEGDYAVALFSGMLEHGYIKEFVKKKSEQTPAI